MDLIIRKYEDKDYSIVANWWIKNKWLPIPPQYLPEDGFIVDDLCAGFLYKTNSKLCWLEFIISNPDSNKDIRDQALDLLIKNLIDLAKEQNFGMIFTSSVHPKLIERYKKFNFSITDENVVHLTRSL